jgi:hypothetical protein
LPAPVEALLGKAKQCIPIDSRYESLKSYLLSRK